MLFNTLFAYKRLKRGVTNPKEFAIEESMGILKGILIVISMIALPIIVLFGALGYTSWIIHPNSIARFLFWIFAVIYFIWFMISRTVYKRIKRGAEYVANKITK